MNKEKTTTTKLKKTKVANFKAIEVVSLIVITSIVSIVMGILVGTRVDNKEESEYVFDDDLTEFLDNYQYILDNYYGDADKSVLLEGALNGLLGALGDDYSEIINEKDADNFNIRLDGNYEGIGVEIYSYDGYIYISNVFEESPASQAGLVSGDIILSIDGIDYTNKPASDITSYVKKSKNPTFKITILRGEEKIDVQLNRSNIIIQSVTSKLIEQDNQKIGYMHIDIFANVTGEQFKTELDELESKGIDSLIIDVRNNSGGYLTSVVDVLSNLLDSTNIIYQTESKAEKKVFSSKGKTTKTYPIVVLQNSGSASASELLSIALKEQYGATVIGENSYGKGTVQELVTTDSTEYKFTTKKWLSPKGNWINGVGVTPDVEILLDDVYHEFPSEENDNQLKRAIEFLKK